MSNRTLYIIAGCNGAGKTTASFTLLPDMLSCPEFVNADEIARGLSPFHPSDAALEAGRIMLNRIAELIDKGQSFAFETTLSGTAYLKKILEARNKGYVVLLLFLWLDNPEMAMERVKIRVREGGHDIPDDVIKRRYIRGVKNLFGKYLKVADATFFVDNSQGQFRFMAQRTGVGKFLEYEPEIFSRLKAVAS